MELPDEADFAVTKLGCAILRERTQSQVGEVYVTRGSPIKGAQDVQQGTLTRTRFTYDREHLPFGYLERQVFKEHQVRGSGTKDLLQCFRPDHQILLYLMQLACSSAQTRAVPGHTVRHRTP